MARIAIGGFGHESNGFAPGRTDLAHFLRGGELPPLAEGTALLDGLAGGNFGVSGAIDRLGEHHDLVPTVWAHGGAGSLVGRAAFETIAGRLVSALGAARADGVYLDLHGAMMAEGIDDGEGEILERLRGTIGPEVPICISLDYHANVTERMVRHADAITVYRTYPHVDRAETGARAAALLDRLVATGERPRRALRRIPFLLPLPFQCTGLEPTRGILDTAAAELDAGGDLLALEYAAGFPPADFPECGPSVFAYARTAERAAAAADALAARVCAAEADFVLPLLAPERAVGEARQMLAGGARRVVLADVQDNPGAGGTGDTTDLLAAVAAGRIGPAAFAAMIDPDAAAAAHAAGEGAKIQLALGGRSGPEGVEPFAGDFVVKALSTGRFRACGRTIGGRDVDLGPMALLGHGDVDVLVATKRMQANDPGLFAALGVRPEDYRLLALKSAVHFRADFEPLADAVLLVEAPGWHVVSPRSYPYRRLPASVRRWPGSAP